MVGRLCLVGRIKKRDLGTMSFICLIRRRMLGLKKGGF